MARDPLDYCIGFDWDDGNIDKNWFAHRVTWWESEEVFFNRPRPTFDDMAHSTATEKRFYILGQTNAGRHLFVGFTVRRRLIRPITARDMTARERITYELYSKKDSEVH